MDNLATIVVLDEINVYLSDVYKHDIDTIVKETAIFRPEARHTAAYKLKRWDGKESNVSYDGKTYIYMLPTIIPILERLGYKITLEDRRKPYPLVPEYVTKNFLDEYGIILRYYQVSAINSVIKYKKGTLDYATSSGKTIITAGIVKSFESLNTIVIVPSEKLANQTFDDISKVGVDVGLVHGKVSAKKREEAWNKNHLVVTWQTLKNNKDKCSKYDVILYDESHIIGDVMFDILTNYMNNAYIRIGMTGTVIEEKFKYQKYACVIGGDVIEVKEAHELIDEGFISTIDIEMIPILHNLEIPMNPKSKHLEWDDEFDYLNSNKKRIDKIGDVIRDLRAKNKGNFMVLCHPEVGKKLSKNLGCDFIDKDTKSETREKFFKNFDYIEDYLLVPSYGTTGTGVSIDNIQFMVVVDIGGNKTRIKQSLGRGLRKDGKSNHIKVFDIYSIVYVMNRGRKRIINFGGSKHLSERKRVYTDTKYPFIERDGVEV